MSADEMEHQDFVKSVAVNVNTVISSSKAIEDHRLVKKKKNRNSKNRILFNKF